MGPTDVSLLLSGIWFFPVMGFRVILSYARLLALYKVCHPNSFSIYGYPQAGPDESLRDVAMKILDYKISTIPIIEESYPLLLHVACLGGILKCGWFYRSYLNLKILSVFSLGNRFSFSFPCKT